MSRTPRLGRAALAVPVTACLLLGGLGVVAPGASATVTRPAAQRHFVDRAGPNAPAPTLPTATQQQVEADRPVPVPGTPSCTETVMVHDFASSYGAPYQGTYEPPSGCPGPWSTVVLTLTSTVGGVQFDRDVYVAIGNAVMLDGSTSEPCCTGSNDVTWSVSRDVTEYTPLLTAAQPVMVELDNVTDSTYTGVYHTTLTLTFYDTAPGVPTGNHPDVVLPVSSTSPSSPMFTISQPDEHPGSSIVFPRNLVRLQAELFADAHGPCEEFWWSDPTNCAGTPYREVAVYIDGQLAGAAPTYPVTYTGADGPGLWEPIPSPRAWNLRPYVVDLTPFVGTLTDGRPHTVSLGILDATLASGDFWDVAANLLGWVEDGQAVTTGGLSAAATPPAPTDQPAWDPSGAARYTDTSSHKLTFAGWVDTPNGIVSTRVVESMGETDAQTQVSDRASWTWDATTTTDGDGHDTVADASSSYSMFVTDLSHFQFTDDDSTSTLVDGVKQNWSITKEQMSTSDATGEAVGGVERERYGYADSSGTCYDHVIDVAGGEVAVNRLDSGCPGAALVPPTDLPEVPVSPVALVGLAGLGLLGLLARRRARS